MNKQRLETLEKKLGSRKKRIALLTYGVAERKPEDPDQGYRDKSPEHPYGFKIVRARGYVCLYGGGGQELRLDAFFTDSGEEMQEQEGDKAASYIGPWSGYKEWCQEQFEKLGGRVQVLPAIAIITRDGSLGEIPHEQTTPEMG